ncbi:uncharacterized protein F5891DRAFT_979395 [Suillus fuscotomentosus]|uniref:Uncharacterized protein n=1 Tax=Suillus fuscotomentosus TaxID=1912939 RepID=A0AAD4HM68_9AGAM|nr:uncharacterized protein F5891DRAFT_979395 [Suillus fuscotomentosus]KAG1901572.1 hypothetical protein F5891DRAFT_979395 [Suillus fuscotomentosus]
MDNACPIKWVCFQEAVHDNANANTLQWKALVQINQLQDLDPPFTGLDIFLVELSSLLAWWWESMCGKKGYYTPRPHVKTIIELHKCKYMVLKLFKIPAKVNPPLLIPSSFFISGPITPGQSISPPIMLFHLHQIPELALLANQWYTSLDTEGEKAVQTRKSFISRFSSGHPYIKMKRLFMWALLQLYKQGSIVLYDGLLDAPTASVFIVPLFRTIFSTPDATKSMIAEDNTYLSDPPCYEEDQAYIPVTATLLSQPVRDIMCIRGIRGKSIRVRAEDITKDLERLDSC